MEEEMDKGNKKEAMDPIMMEEDWIKKIMENVGKMRSGVPYQYKMNNKKRAIADRQGLESDEEEVEDIRDVNNIEEILCATYEMKIGGPRPGTEGRTLIQIIVSVEPTTPCVTNTPGRTRTFRQPNFSGKRTTRHVSNQGESTRGDILGNNSQLSTPCIGNS
jgi:hypothetical protein